jgi:hypothetical protein
MARHDYRCFSLGKELYIAAEMDTILHQVLPYIATKYEAYAQWDQDTMLPARDFRSLSSSYSRTYAAFLTRSSAGNAIWEPLRRRRCFNFRHDTP